MLRLIAFILFLTSFFYTTSSATTIALTDTIQPEKFKSIDTTTLWVNNIIIAGNRVTKPHIIERELLFKKGEVFNVANFENLATKSKNNLNNTGLFTYYKINYAIVGPNQADIIVLVGERWRFWPFPITELADRNINSWWLTKDPTRINYGVLFNIYNVTGRNEILYIILKKGFNRQVAAEYTLPGIGVQQQHGLGAKISYTTNNQLIINTINNKINFFKEESSHRRIIRNEFYTYLKYSYRGRFYMKHFFTLKYSNITVSDTVIYINPDYITRTQDNDVNFFTLSYNLKYDKRDYKAYPLKGDYIEFLTEKNGFNLIQNEDVNNWYATLMIKKFLKLDKGFYYAISAKSKISGRGFQPYYFVKGLGYKNDIIRGFEYNTFDGQNYWYIKNNIKYELIEPKIIQPAHKSTNAFNVFKYGVYVNVFGDAGKVTDRQTLAVNNLSKNYLYGYGVGLDFITIYDMVLRLEYSLNSINQKGFFIHLEAPI